MVHIGKKELSSAIRTLSDVSQSKCPVDEIRSAITQLRLAMENFPETNERRTQTALLIAVCYKIIGDDVLSNTYKQLSIDYFDRTAYLQQEACIGMGLRREEWEAPLNEGFFTSSMFDDNHLEDEYGIIWTGPAPASLAEKIISLFKSKSYNQRFREGVLSAVQQYKQKVNQLFD